MLGAIIGDVVGSRFEFHNIKTKEFELFSPQCCFTDDTILTCAVADALVHDIPPDKALQKWGLAYQNRFYENGQIAPFGKGFMTWLQTQKSYQSATNGCVMRISPVGLYYPHLQDAIDKALQFTQITHNHPESIRATQAYIETMHLVKHQTPIDIIKNKITTTYKYDLSKKIDDIRPSYNRFYCSCQNSVPQAIICALDAVSFEDAIRNAVSLGGDSDTLASMAGGIAEVKFGIPSHLKKEVFKYLDTSVQETVRNFYTCKNQVNVAQLPPLFHNQNQKVKS